MPRFVSSVAQRVVGVEVALLCVATNMIFVVVACCHVPGRRSLESVLAFAEPGCGDEWCWCATAFLLGVNITMTETRFLYIVLEH